MPTESGVGRCLSRSFSVITYCADHPPGFADVKLVRPVMVVEKLVFGQAPLAHFAAHIFRHARIVREKVHQALLIRFVLRDDLPPRS